MNRQDEINARSIRRIANALDGIDKKLGWICEQVAEEREFDNVDIEPTQPGERWKPRGYEESDTNG